ncbi:MAG TPA: hypothetical protein PKW08_09320 [Flavobacteriaceae bacterium]|nr:hypothetical protein [Flavobacteriaceae bacterium]MCB9212153.1 hypothetical protein [Alteromonas sp.]HPF10468.1 hypothetical protein [Flavobacteriaceae bacterium]HQU21777.1 hypothetical protein [Flavobacteriaceae bacterium]HQU64679.1 hypothetical protein [Flavobacteriaceae bacterium]
MKGILMVFGFFVWGLGATLQAHNPGHIAYAFDEPSKTLTIRLTSQSLAELLVEVRPELKNTAIDFNHYAEFLMDYFNKTLFFSVGNEKAFFSLKEKQFGSHDAVLVFAIQKVTTNWKAISVTATSFNEIYQNPTHVITVQNGASRKSYILNAENPQVDFEMEDAATFQTVPFQHLASYGVILFLLVVSVYWINLRKSKKRLEISVLETERRH